MWTNRPGSDWSLNSVMKHVIRLLTYSSVTETESESAGKCSAQMVLRSRRQLCEVVSGIHMQCAQYHYASISTAEIVYRKCRLVAAESTLTES